MSASPSERVVPGVREVVPSILVVDDEKDTRELYAIAFEAQGYRVFSAGSADEALHLLRRERFDVVVADYNLPETTGTALIQQATREGLLEPHATALICTGSKYVRPPSGVMVIRKPVDPTGLVGLIELARAQTADRVRSS